MDYNLEAPVRGTGRFVYVGAPISSNDDILKTVVLGQIFAAIAIVGRS